MMTHEEFNRRYRPFLFCVVCLCGLFIGLSLCSCRSTRTTVEETQGETHTSVKECFTSDTLHTAATAKEESRDSAVLCSDQHSTIKIQRDSTGRIVEIVAARSEKVRAITEQKSELDHRFYGLNETRRSETSGSEDSVTQTKKEDKKDYRFGSSLEMYVGLTIFGLIILFYIGDYIYRLWKKRVGK